MLVEGCEHNAGLLVNTPYALEVTFVLISRYFASKAGRCILVRLLRGLQREPLCLPGAVGFSAGPVWTAPEEGRVGGSGGEGMPKATESNGQNQPAYYGLAKTKQSRNSLPIRNDRVYRGRFVTELLAQTGQESLPRLEYRVGLGQASGPASAWTRRSAPRPVSHRDAPRRQYRLASVSCPPQPLAHPGASRPPSSQLRCVLRRTFELLVVVTRRPIGSYSSGGARAGRLVRNGLETWLRIAAARAGAQCAA
jgi:hypothetical protein